MDLSKYNFAIPLTTQGDPDPMLFMQGNAGVSDSAKDRKWVKAAEETIRANPAAKTEILHAAPSAPALRSLQKSLERYDGPMPVTKEQWQNFVLQKYFEQAADPDPKVSKPALDALARTNVVGLNQEVQEVNISVRSTVEIESELLQVVNGLLSKPKEKVIDAEFTQWTD